MIKSNLFVPSSVEHCASCAFEDVSVAVGASVLQSEQDLVRDHLHETFGRVTSTNYSSKRIQEAALGKGVSAKRLLAARMCARAIQTGECQDYMFINRGRGNKPKLERKKK